MTITTSVVEFLFDLPTEFSGSNQTPIHPSVGTSLPEFNPLLLSFLEDSTNHSNPRPGLPGQILNSRNKLKDHGFENDSNAAAFYWSKHQMPVSGVRNLTAKAFSLHTEQVLNAESRFSLTVSNLLIQLTESQTELFAQCMLHAANSKHPQLSIFGHTHVPTSEDDFRKVYLSGLNTVVPNLPHPIHETTADGKHSFCWFNRSSRK